MSSYTKINLDDVEDMAPKFQMPEGMSARFPKGELGCEKVAVSHQTLGPDLRAPFGHRQHEQEEIYVVLSGGGRMKLDDDVVDLRPRDVIRVAPETMRAFESGPQGLEFLAFGGPIGENRDGEVVPDWWTD